MVTFVLRLRINKSMPAQKKLEWAEHKKGKIVAQVNINPDDIETRLSSILMYINARVSDSQVHALLSSMSEDLPPECDSVELQIGNTVYWLNDDRIQSKQCHTKLQVLAAWMEQSITESTVSNAYSDSRHMASTVSRANSNSRPTASAASDANSDSRPIARTASAADSDNRPTLVLELANVLEGDELRMHITGQKQTKTVGLMHSTGHNGPATVRLKLPRYAQLDAVEQLRDQFASQRVKVQSAQPR